MYIVFLLAIAANILSIIILLIGLLCKFKQPKNKAIFGYCVFGSILLYTALLGIVAICFGISNFGLYCFILTLCIISQFMIGKFVRYETLKKYTILQIMFYTVSLVTLLLK